MTFLRENAAAVQAIASVVLVLITWIYVRATRQTQRTMERTLVSDRESDVAPIEVVVSMGGQDGNKPIALVTLKNFGHSVASRVETGAWISGSPPETVIPWFASQVITLSPGEQGSVCFAAEDPKTYRREEEAFRGRWGFELRLYIDWHDPLRGLLTRDAIFVWDGQQNRFHANYISGVFGSVLTERTRAQRARRWLASVPRRFFEGHKEVGLPQRPTSNDWDKHRAEVRAKALRDSKKQPKGNGSRRAGS